MSIKVTHRGGWIIQHFRAFRTIFLIVGLSVVIFGCATRKNQGIDTDFGLAAKAAPEGILLTFSNLPSDISHLWIHVTSQGGNEEPESRHATISSFAGITDTSAMGWVNGTQQLEKVKQTGKVIFPIVQAGQKYRISAFIYNQQERHQGLDDIYFQPRRAETECVAEKGIYFNSDSVKLELDKANSVVTLSREPIFSSDVTFDTQKYSYGVTILVSETRSIGVGDHHIPDGLSPDGLTWTFEPHMTTVNLRQLNSENNWLENDRHYPAWAEARVNIIYDDIAWSVEIAKTPEFIFSLPR